MIKQVAVFCGSKSGENPLFITHAEMLGKQLAELNIGLVYGGGNSGLMGAVANAALQYGGQVTGVIPQILFDREHQHQAVQPMYVVENMHVRKKMMYELCDMAIILPGGYGTMDELFEMITWNNLKIHDKRLAILNSDGYYDSLLHFIDHMQQQGFLYEQWKERIEVYSHPAEITF